MLHSSWRALGWSLYLYRIYIRRLHLYIFYVLVAITSSLYTATIKSASAPRIRSNNAVTKLPPVPAEQLKEKAAARAQNQADIDVAIQEWFDATQQTANQLAERFNKKPRFFLDAFFHGGARMINHHEKVNPHNAFISRKANELREGVLSIFL
jgi:hypothetical protein